MAGPIDTAYVEFEAQTGDLERGANVAFDELADVGRHVAQSIEIAFESMTDRLIDEFQLMRREADQNFDGLLTGVERVGAEIGDAIDHGTEQAELGFTELAARARTSMDDVGDSTRRVSEHVGGMTSRMSTAISTMMGFVGGNAVMNGLSQAYQFAKGAVIGFNETIQNSTIAFTTMLGSGQKAQTFLNQLQAFAKATPFEFEGLVKNAQQMMGMGIAAQDVIPDLTALGDSVASVGGSASQVDQVTLAFDQMAAKGTLDMGNMNQLLEGGVPNALKILADSYKVTTGEMINMISTGQVQSADALPKLIDGIEHGTKSVAALGGMMDKQSHTMSGALSNIKDGLTQAISGAFRPFFNVVAAGANTLGNFFSGNAFSAWADKISAGMSKILDLFKYTIGWITGNGSDAIAGWGDDTQKKIDKVEEVIATFADAVRTVFTNVKNFVINDVVPALKTLWDVFGPLLLAGIAAASSAFASLSGVLTPLGGVVKDVFGFIDQHKEIFQAIAVSIAGAVVALQGYNAVMSLVTTATKVWTAAQVALDVAMDANPVGLIVIAIGAVIGAVVYLWFHFEGFRKFFIAAWNDIWGVLKAIGGWFAGPFAHFFIDTWNAIWGFFKAIGAWFAGPFAGFFVRAFNFIMALPGRILTFVRSLPERLVQLFTTGMQRLAYVVGFGIGLVVKFWVELPGKIWGLITSLWDTAVQLFNTGVTNIVNFAEALPGRVVAFFTQLWTDVVAATKLGTELLINFISSLPGRFVSFIQDMWNRAKQLFRDGVSAIVSEAQALPGQLWGIISGIPGMIGDALGGLGSMLYGIGKDIVNSLVQGVKDMLGWAKDQVKNLAGSVVNGFKDALKFGSPSKVMIDLGVGTVQSYAIGVNQEIGTAHAAVKRIISPALDASAGKSVASPVSQSHTAGFSGTVVVNVGGRQVAGTIVDILYDNPQHVALAAQQGERRLARR